MSELMSKLDGGEIIPIFMFAVMGVVAIVATIAGVWYHWRKSEIEASLKAEMVKQGRSAEEIERILKATGRTDKDSELKQKVIKAALKEGKSSEEIDRILRSV